MANIVILTQFTDDAGVIKTKSMLEGFDHTVDILSSSLATVSGLSAYHCIVACLYSVDSAHTQVILDAMAIGTPVLTGLPASPYSNGLEFISGMTNSTSGLNSTQLSSAFIVDSCHAISSVGKKFAVKEIYISASFMYDAEVNSIHSSCKILALREHQLSKALCFFATKGDANSSGGIYPSNIAFCGWLYGINGYTEYGAAVIGELVLMLIAGSKTISGSVSDENGSPAQRRITAIYRGEGEVAATTVSLANGEYSLNVIDGYDYAVLCSNAEDGTLIFDRL